MHEGNTAEGLKGFRKNCRPSGSLSGVARRNDYPHQLGHASLDVTLAYLKGKDAESAEKAMVAFFDKHLKK